MALSWAGGQGPRTRVCRGAPRKGPSTSRMSAASQPPHHSDNALAITGPLWAPLWSASGRLRKATTHLPVTSRGLCPGNQDLHYHFSEATRAKDTEVPGSVPCQLIQVPGSTQSPEGLSTGTRDAHTWHLPGPLPLNTQANGILDKPKTGAEVGLGQRKQEPQTEGGRGARGPPAATSSSADSH